MYADITIKARCSDPAEVESILLEHNAVYKGLDVQTDTYYASDYSKLKLRQGNIENVLIHYYRERSEGANKTEVLLYLKNPSESTIQQVCGGKKIVAVLKKLRKIFYIDHVKFHIDKLEDKGSFIEIEVIDLDGSMGIDELHAKCNYYKELLMIAEEDIINDSYIDL